MMATEPRAPELGEVVDHGRFELLSTLGEGGTSLVYRARDHREGVDVALKLLLPRYVGRPEREQRLINEAEYLRRLRGHAHVVQFVAAGRLQDRGDWPWLATEVLSGNTLDLEFVRGKLPLERILQVARSVADALRGCHAVGVVHRDATPSNVFVLDDADKTIKLFDFSHAADLWAPRVAVGSPGRLTGVHDVPGTLGYMGPEQVRQEPAAAGMDVFGFGVLLFELVTRQNPYAAIRDRGDYIKAQRAGLLEAPRLHAWAHAVPDALAKLVHDCTRRAADERPTMAEVHARLEEILGASATIGPVQIPARPRARLAPAVAGLLALGVLGIAWQQHTRDADHDGDAVLPIAEAPEPELEQPASVEPEAAPKPQPEAEPKPQPEAEPEPQPEPEPQHSPPPPSIVDPCEGVVDRARQALADRDWRRAVSLSANRKCWSSQADRTALRVTAFAELGEWSKCVDAGAGSTDPAVRIKVDGCRTFVAPERSP
jgi:serine/threonine protein kinase